MTEAEWLACEDPSAMLSFLGERASDRKLRLFACAVCRRMGYRIGKGGEEVIATAERFADGQADDWDLVVTEETLASTARPVTSHRELHAKILEELPRVGLLTDLRERQGLKLLAGLAGQFDGSILLRDIFGNPFRPAALDLAWRTETVLALARGIYEERAFDRMPILADALQDAGCTDEDILNHCRGPGPHARGCWVVDVVLGKE